MVFAQNSNNAKDRSRNFSPHLPPSFSPPSSPPPPHHTTRSRPVCSLVSSQKRSWKFWGLSLKVTIRTQPEHTQPKHTLPTHTQPRHTQPKYIHLRHPQLRRRQPGNTQPKHIQLQATKHSHFQHVPQVQVFCFRCQGIAHVGSPTRTTFCFLPRVGPDRLDELMEHKLRRWKAVAAYHSVPWP